MDTNEVRACQCRHEKGGLFSKYQFDSIGLETLPGSQTLLNQAGSWSTSPFLVDTGVKALQI